MDSTGGIGLIERRKQGQGKPTLIYVRNFYGELIREHILYVMESMQRNTAQQVKKEFEIEFGSTIDDLLESVYLAGADLGGTKIESHARCIERSNQMLRLLGNAVDILRTRHKSGETYYWLLYYTFLFPQQLDNVDEIIEQLQPHIRDISRATYHR